MTDNGLAEVYITNALNLIKSERRTARRLNEVYSRLSRIHLEAGVVDWLANPFIQTALSILDSFQSNYKIKQAIALLKEAGADVEKEKKKKKKR